MNDYIETPTFYDLRDLRYFVLLCDENAVVYGLKVERKLFDPDALEEFLGAVYELCPVKKPDFADDYVIETFDDEQSMIEFSKYYGLQFIGSEEGVKDGNKQEGDY